MAGGDVKRPSITVGMLAVLTLIPLALTSTTGMIRRLGARRWTRLHRLVYLTGVLAALHFIWLAKVGRTDQYIYARSEEHTSELQSQSNLVCRLLLEKKKKNKPNRRIHTVSSETLTHTHQIA